MIKHHKGFVADRSFEGHMRRHYQRKKRYQDLALLRQIKVKEREEQNRLNRLFENDRDNERSPA